MTEIPKSETPGMGLVIGYAAIAAELGVKAHNAEWLARTKRIPVFKLGRNVAIFRDDLHSHLKAMADKAKQAVSDAD